MEAAGQLHIKMESWGERWSLWALGDLHLLNRGCHEKLLDRTVQQIADDPRALWAGIGDFADLISSQDKRFDPEMVGERVSVRDLGKLGPVAKAAIRRKFEPIAHKCVGMIRGNHEWSYENRFEQAIVQDVVSELNTWLAGQRGSKRQWRIPYMDYCGFRDLVFTCGKHSRRFRVCIHHGAGFARTKGGKINRLEQFMRIFEANIYLMGHVHASIQDVVMVVGADEKCETIVEAQKKVGVITGTFLKTYTQGASGYAERKMYDAVPLGAPRVLITPADDKRPLGVEMPW